MWPFSRKKQQAPDNGLRDSAPRTNVALVGNAPSHWPPVIMRALYPGQGKLSSMNKLLFSGAVAKALQGHEDWLRLQGLAQQKPLGGGYVHVPMTINDRGVAHDLFFYIEPSEDNARHFAGLCALYREQGLNPPVYYCPEALPPLPEDTLPVSPLHGFDFDMLGRHQGPIPPGEYAMWWQSEGTPGFMDSGALHDLDRAYQAMHGIESYLGAALLRALDRRKYGETFRVDLPEQPLLMPFRGTDDQVMVAELSRDKGLRLLFSVAHTTPAHRDRFLGLYADYVETWRARVLERELPLDPPEQQSGLQWWQRMKSSIAALEEGGEPLDSLARLNI